MRVCIINEYFHPETMGGTGTVLSSLARELTVQFEEVEIDVMTSRNQYHTEGSPLPAEETWEGIRIHRLKSPKPGPSTKKRLLANIVFSLLVTLRLLRQPRFDVLLVGTAPPTAPLAAWIYSRFTGTPYVYITYDLEPDRAVALKVLPPGSRFVRILKRLQGRWLMDAGKVVVLGRCMAHYVMENYALPADRVEIIPIGFDPEQVAPASHCTRFRAMQGLDGFVALYAGNFGRYHNFDAILDAAKALKDRDVTVALVGKGAQRSHIERRIKAEGITNVRMFDFVPLDRFADMIVSADVCLVTLEKGMEGLCVPSKLYGYMAAGRPSIVLAGQSSEVSLVVAESECGIHVDPDDANGLVRAISRLSDRPEEAARMGRNARRRLVEHFANSIVAGRYHGVLAAAAQRRTPAEPDCDAASAIVSLALEREPAVAAPFPSEQPDRVTAAWRTTADVRRELRPNDARPRATSDGCFQHPPAPGRRPRGSTLR
jgi:glycosyltransferase involved in cell wall biosynthesis